VSKKHSARFIGISAMLWFVLSLCSSIAHADDQDDPLTNLFDQQQDTLWSGVSLTGYLKNETAYRIREPRSFTKIRNIVALNLSVPINDTFELTASGWAYYDLVYDLYDYQTIAARFERNALDPLIFVENLPEEKDSPVVDIRELYLDVFLGDLEMRIGKQFVIWGVMTGVRIVDEINPMDFRELILLDLLDYRVPLWTYKADYFGDNINYEFLWIPDIQFHKPAARGSEWELLQKVPGTRYPESFTLENSELGFKVGTTLLGTELSLSYFYTWDDFPVIFRSVNLADQEGAAKFFPTYTRIHMLGSTFSRSVRGMIVKGEAAYVKGKYFGTSIVDHNNDQYLDHNGELQRDHIRWGVGIDFNLWKTDFSPGFVQWIILNHNDDIIQDRVDSSFNLFVRKEFPAQSVVAQMLGIYLINFKEVYVKPKLTYTVTPQFQIGFGVDYFFGEKTTTGVVFFRGREIDLREVEEKAQFIGNFLGNDRVFVEFKYGF